MGYVLIADRKTLVSMITIDRRGSKKICLSYLRDSSCMFVTKPTVLLRQITLSDKHWWFSGRILACHAGDLGSIPGQCKCSASSCLGKFFYLSRPGVSAASEEYISGKEEKKKKGVTSGLKLLNSRYTVECSAVELCPFMTCSILI